MTMGRYGEPLPLGSDEIPYSKGVMARALIAAGVPAEGAYRMARRMELDLAERGEASAGPERLLGIAQEVLGEEAGGRAAERLRRLADLQSIDVPLIILIGGTTGSGKSTVAVEVARRLGITRVASTDLIRQTMRAFFSPEFMPSIHYSSFEAGQVVGDEVTGEPTVAGFVDQCRHVCVGAEAAMRRAITENWSMVLEGVHVVPGLLPVELDRALIVQVVVEVRDIELHRLNFHVRDAATGGVRGVKKYIDHLDEIRRIQSYVTMKALREQIPVIDNVDLERTIVQILEVILDVADRSATRSRGASDATRTDD
jgi:2-phosphoglycerate kinase